MDKKLNTKDFINIGIFTALYFVVMFVVAFIGYIPILMVAVPALCALVGAIPFMLFLTRAKKFGMITIMGTLLGLLSFLLGRPWLSILCGCAAGLLADLYLKSADYNSIKKSKAGCGIFSLWITAMALPMFFGYRDAYMEGMRAGYGDAYVEALMGYTPAWMFWVMLLTMFLGGLIGAMIGSMILKKHFARAGMI